MPCTLLLYYKHIHLLPIYSFHLILFLTILHVLITQSPISHPFTLCEHLAHSRLLLHLPSNKLSSIVYHHQHAITILVLSPRSCNSLTIVLHIFPLHFIPFPIFLTRNRLLRLSISFSIMFDVSCIYHSIVSHPYMSQDYQSGSPLDAYILYSSLTTTFIIRTQFFP